MILIKRPPDPLQSEIEKRIEALKAKKMSSSVNPLEDIEVDRSTLHRLKT